VALVDPKEMIKDGPRGTIPCADAHCPTVHPPPPPAAVNASVGYCVGPPPPPPPPPPSPVSPSCQKKLDALCQNSTAVRSCCAHAPPTAPPPPPPPHAHHTTTSSPSSAPHWLLPPSHLGPAVVFRSTSEARREGLRRLPAVARPRFLRLRRGAGQAVAAWPPTRPMPRRIKDGVLAMLLRTCTLAGQVGLVEFSQAPECILFLAGSVAGRDCKGMLRL
jgi:hypothetical protein